MDVSEKYPDITEGPIPMEEPKSKCLQPYLDSLAGGQGYQPEVFASDHPDVEHGGRVTRDDADYHVATAAEFRNALNDLADGEVVWLKDGMTLDCRSWDTVETTAEDITIASARSQGGPGALVLVSKGSQPFLKLSGANSRVTGIRFLGDELEYFDPADRYPDMGGDAIYGVGLSCAVQASAPGCELDNIKAHGFIYCGLRVEHYGYTIENDQQRCYIHHCDLANNPAGTLGYGFAVGQGNPVVEYCWFNNNRHSIAGAGYENSGYHIRRNVFGPKASLQVVDMHGQDVDGQEAQRAGRRLLVENNVFQTYTSYFGDNTGNEGTITIVWIRGIPSDHAYVRNNVFYNPNRPAEGTDGTWGDIVNQSYNASETFENITVEKNTLGQPDPRAEIPRASLMQERAETAKELVESLNQLQALCDNQ